MTQMPYEIDWMAQLVGTLIWLNIIAMFVVFWLVESWGDDEE